MSGIRIDSLTKDNYETWKIQMKALLIKSDSWVYVSGSRLKPELIPADPKSIEAIEKWAEMDEKAKSDIILCIAPSELKQVKSCATSLDVWCKLKDIYESKGPARKASLLKSLIQHKMADTTSPDVRDHLRKFFDIVDKLNEMEIRIDEDLLAVMLLYSLPPSFENFRYAMESRDELPKPEVLRIKIVEESDARRQDRKSNDDGGGAFAVTHLRRKPPWKNKSEHFQKSNSQFSKTQDTSKIRCWKCRRLGHRAAACDQDYQKKDTSRFKQENASFLTCAESGKCGDALLTHHGDMVTQWAIDSGCTRHLCNDKSKFVNISDTEIKILNLANNETTEVLGSGKAVIKAEINKEIKDVDVFDALLVPDLRTNLLSVAKLCDRGYIVTFKSDIAKIVNTKSNLELIADRKDNLYYLRGSNCSVNQSANQV